MLIWGTAETGLTCELTPLAPLVTSLHLIRTHPCSDKICEVAQSLFWMVLSSGDGLKSVLGWGSDPGVLPWGWGSWEGKIFTLAQISDILPCPRQRSKFLLVWLHLSPYFLSVSIFLLIFYWSPSFPSFSAHLHLFLHFLFVSISILIFWLSLPLSSFSVCLLIDRDWEKMRKMVTDRKQRKR